MKKLILLIYQIVTGIDQVLPVSWYCTYNTTELDYECGVNLMCPEKFHSSLFAYFDQVSHL